MKARVGIFLCVATGVSATFACGTRTGLGIRRPVDASVIADGDDRGVDATVDALDDQNVADAQEEDAFQLSIRPSLALGQGRSCAVLGDGGLRCWGNNLYGALGDGTTTNRLAPVDISVGLPVAMAGSGMSSTCALLTNGTVRCWGANSWGQLGNGTLGGASLSPAVVTSLSNAAGLSVGGLQACVLQAGAAACWGAQNGGGYRSVPTSIVLLGAATHLAAGVGFACALMADTTIECLGENSLGQLGDGTQQRRLKSVPVANLTNSIDVAAGSKNACAVTKNGRVWCWGDNSHQQLGDGTTNEMTLTPVEVLGITTAIQVGVGSASACALLQTGRVVCWGMNESGQLGDGTTTDRATSTEVVMLSGVVQLAVGWHHACALLANGTARCWGANGGALGNGMTANSSIPVDVLGLP